MNVSKVVLVGTIETSLIQHRLVVLAKGAWVDEIEFADKWSRWRRILILSLLNLPFRDVHR